MSGQQPSRYDEQGSVSVLVIGFFVLAALLVAVVVDASAAYLRRQELSALADGAAVAAADGVRTESIYLEGVPDELEVDPAAARARVSAYLARASGPELRGLRVRVTTTGDTVRVSLSGPLDLPLTPDGWVDRTTVVSEAAAVSQVSD